MRRFNNLMADALNRISTLPKLHDNLLKIIEEGFVSKGDCLFLKYFFKIRGMPNLIMIHDQTGAEAFVNGFHTDDYVDDDHLGQALTFIDTANRAWLQSPYSESEDQLRWLVALTEYGANIKLIKVRALQPYLDDDLEEYEQPILEITYSKQVPRRNSE